MAIEFGEREYYNLMFKLPFTRGNRLIGYIWFECEMSYLRLFYQVDVQENQQILSKMKELQGESRRLTKLEKDIELMNGPMYNCND